MSVKPTDTEAVNKFAYKVLELLGLKEKYLGTKSETEGQRQDKYHEHS